MQVTIEPGRLHGGVTAPPSKSHLHRLLIAAALSDGLTWISCAHANDDADATAGCLNALGADVLPYEGAFAVRGGLSREGAAYLDCRESGSTLRFLLPLCAALPREITLVGQGRLPERPLAPLIAALCQGGAQIDGDRLPLRLRGGLRSGVFTLAGGESSQYFTGLLFALPLLSGDRELMFSSPLESRPYVDMTLQTLDRFGVRAEPLPDGWRIPGAQRYLSPGAAETEGDWSAAAFFLAANALGSRVTVGGLDPSSRQGDRAVEALLSRIGGEIDVSQTPDLMPALSAAAAAVPDAETRIVGAARLRLKESDRIAAMARAIRALGGEAEETPDGLCIRGRQLKGGTVDGCGDHRVVMSAAVAATACQGPVTILGAEAVRKSYPGFFEAFRQAGGIFHV